MSRYRHFDVYVRRPGSRWRRVGPSKSRTAADFTRSIFDEMAIPVKVIPVRHASALSLP